ncbi:MAG TPA: hypothetical protein VNM24_13195 [Burkholderiales bacterium]|jgi:hypothetical protein|nr:hypothetical protein [Burkholderiales bacterium]
MEAINAADRQKAKLAMLFGTLGVVGFLLVLFAGFGLWGHARSRDVPVPTYDRFVGELQATAPGHIPQLTRAIFEKWSACETTRRGMASVAIHALISSSLVAIALFTLCLVLNVQLYRRLSALASAAEPPQPPERVDDTWRS